jgi:hypothetical protein
VPPYWANANETSNPTSAAKAYSLACRLSVVCGIVVIASSSIQMVTDDDSVLTSTAVLFFRSTRQTQAGRPYRWAIRGGCARLATVLKTTGRMGMARGRPRLKLEGRRFGRLTVVRFARCRKYRGKNHNTIWLCRCDCGKEVEVIGTNLNRSGGGVRSCDCILSDANAVSGKERGVRAAAVRELWGAHEAP